MFSTYSSVIYVILCRFSCFIELDFTFEFRFLASPPDQSVNGGLLLLVGIFVGGASNIVGTAVTTDVGKQEAIGNDVDALSTVTGGNFSGLLKRPN